MSVFRCVYFFEEVFGVWLDVLLVGVRMNFGWTTKFELDFVS